MKNKIETRKIQTTGGSTFTVSLPKKWVEEMGLGAGDEMAVEEQSSSLLLSPAKSKEEKSLEAKIEVKDGDNCDAIKRKILSLYLVGYNAIHIESAGGRLKPEYRKAIKNLARNKLVGTEIISESMEKVTLQTLISYSELSAKGALRRMFSVASSMQENSIVALENHDKELAQDIIEIDDEVDRFQMYLIREVKAAMQSPPLVKEIGLKTLRECLGYRLVSKNVERAGDHSALIAKNVIEMGNPVDEKSLEMLKEVDSHSREIFKKAVDALLKEDYKAAEEVIQGLEKVHEHEEKVNNYLAEEDPTEDIRIRLILESIRRIAEYGGDIAEIVLNLTIDKEH